MLTPYDLPNTDFSKITPCGENCDGCGYLASGECEGCRETDGNCIKMWTNGCQIYKCCKEHDVYFCGICSEFPCDWLVKKIGEWNKNGIAHLTQLKDRYLEYS